LALALDPILSIFVFTAGLLLFVIRPRQRDMHEKRGLWAFNPHVPMVSILLPLYREAADAVARTVRGLELQTYPKEWMELIYIVEPDDSVTRLPASSILRTKTVISDGAKKLKGHALNQGLRHASGAIVFVYDADDEIEPSQVLDAVSLMESRGYDVLQPKVVRKPSRSVVSMFLALDSFMWYGLVLPVLRRLGRYFPLSGEGLVIRRTALERVGGFPEVLTEDAYLAILLAEQGLKFGLLDSTVTEAPPRGWRTHYRQRLRWFRGYLTCLRRTLRADIPLRSKFILTIPFLAPLNTALSVVSWILFTLYWVTWASPTSVDFVAPWMLTSLYTNYIYYWSAFLAYIGNVVIVFAHMRALSDSPYEKYAVLALILPVYWIFLGATAIAAFFKSSTYWGRTERASERVQKPSSSVVRSKLVAPKQVGALRR
jgi:cellulose synthase/poly-beta-1,6-N-acetylglucosamine synthase-like glycosyltransferase